VTFWGEYRRNRGIRQKSIAVSIGAGLYALALSRRKYGTAAHPAWWWLWLKWGKHVAR
jgi:hypothetical protein